MCLLPEVCKLNFASVSYLSGYRCFLRKTRNKSKTGLHLPLGVESANFGNKLCWGRRLSEIHEAAACLSGVFCEY